ncbi:MAG: M48 family metallopeptidase [Candidatus Sumerlaeia bacterium]|nr:M48 family metallopeptidase [Candidatus Sumerlaeia bacterium]
MAQRSTADFFANQARAKTRTGLLVLLFAAGVAGTAAAVWFALSFAIGPWARTPQGALWIAGGTVAFIGAASLVRMLMLAGGGDAVARSLGGRLVVEPKDFQERQLLNIVEEMSLASGVPVPKVYVLEDEAGINAFAAGWKPSTAVVGVTRGALDRFTRDEMQGVVAHEFSHILNGDMRLNIRLMGFVFGLLCVAQAGRYILEGGARGSVHSRRSKDGDGAAKVAMLGFALIIIGFIGTGIARLIKAAVSREREYLADASAVQFTRNPAGLSGALRRIGGLHRGSRVGNPAAEEASHMFFASALDALFATHPPLDKRIKAIDPMFDGKFEPQPPGREAAREATLADMSEVAASGLSTPLRVGARAVLSAPGRIDPRPAAGLLAAIPEELRIAAKTPISLSALICFLLLSRNGEVADRQRSVVLARLGAPPARQAFAWHAQYPELPERARLVLLDLASPTLRLLAGPQGQPLLATARAIADADGSVSIFEHLLLVLLRRRLEPERPRGAPRWTVASSLAPHISAVLSAVAHRSTASDQGRRAAFVMAVRREFADFQLVFEPPGHATYRRLVAALDTLSESSLEVRASVLAAAVACIEHDRHLESAEFTMVRLVAEALEVPMPATLDPSLVAPAAEAPA